MRILLGSMVSAAVVLGACGGDVLVDGASGGTGGAPATSTSSGVPTTTTAVTTTSTAVTTTTTTTTVASSSSGGPCVSTCNQAITQGVLSPCGGTALGIYDALLSCACANTGPCATSCTYNFCLHQAVPPPCAMCLAANCGGNYQLCTAN